MKAFVHNYGPIRCPGCGSVMFHAGAPEKPTVECASGFKCENQGKVFTYEPMTVELSEQTTEDPMTTTPEGAKFAYMHGDHVAFYLMERPTEGALIDRRIFIQRDGTRGEIRHLCGACDEPLPAPTTANIRDI